jgi:hypothetical protein
MSCGKWTAAAQESPADHEKILSVYGNEMLIASALNTQLFVKASIIKPWPHLLNPEHRIL